MVEKKKRTRQRYTKALRCIEMIEWTLEAGLVYCLSLMKNKDSDKAARLVSTLSDIKNTILQQGNRDNIRLEYENTDLAEKIYEVYGESDESNARHITMTYRVDRLFEIKEESDKLMHDLLHMIGLFYSYLNTECGRITFEPFRNRWFGHRDDFDLFVEDGLMKTEEVGDDVRYHFTRQGLDWLSNKTGIRIMTPYLSGETIVKQEEF